MYFYPFQPPSSFFQPPSDDWYSPFSQFYWDPAYGKPTIANPKSRWITTEISAQSSRKIPTPKFLLPKAKNHSRKHKSKHYRLGSNKELDTKHIGLTPPHSSTDLLYYGEIVAGLLGRNRTRKTWYPRKPPTSATRQTSHLADDGRRTNGDPNRQGGSRTDSGQTSRRGDAPTNKNEKPIPQTLAPNRTSCPPRTNLAPKLPAMQQPTCPYSSV